MYGLFTSKFAAGKPGSLEAELFPPWSPSPLARQTLKAGIAADGQHGFLRILEALGLRPRSLETLTYLRKAPLEEVITFPNHCSTVVLHLCAKGDTP